MSLQLLSRRYKAIVFVVAYFLGIYLSASAFALTDNFTQKILPFNCIFTVVNAGTGELHYVTPKACGVFIPPNSQPGNTQPAASQSNFAGNTPFQEQSNSQLQTGSNPSAYSVTKLSPSAPIASIQQPKNTYSSKLSTAQVLMIAGGITIAAIVAFLLIFLF